MLQQTTVKAVIPYLPRFRSPLADRARHWRPPPSTTCSRPGRGSATTAARATCTSAREIVAERHGGQLPATEAELLELPGIGPYTAAAIAAIAFGARATPVDGNIERVMARLFAVRTPLPAAKPELRRLAASLTPARRAGDHAQALMDLGATICTPKSARVPDLPHPAAIARAHAEGLVSTIARRASAKPERPVRRGTGVPGAARGRPRPAAQARRSAACSAACWKCRQRSGARRPRPESSRCASLPCEANLVPGAGRCGAYVHPFPSRDAGLPVARGPGNAR